MGIPKPPTTKIPPHTKKPAIAIVRTDEGNTPKTKKPIATGKTFLEIKEAKELLFLYFSAAPWNALRKSFSGGIGWSGRALIFLPNFDHAFAVSILSRGNRGVVDLRPLYYNGQIESHQSVES